MTVELATTTEGSGPPLVLLHGITEDASFWAPVVPLLTPWATVTTVDLRGHGASPDGDAYDLADMADDVAATFGDEPPLVVGHSWAACSPWWSPPGTPPAASSTSTSPGAGRLQAGVQQAASLLRGSTAEFEGFMTAMFASMHGSTPPAESAALAVRRRPRQDVVTGIWTPLLDWSPPTWTPSWRRRRPRSPCRCCRCTAWTRARTTPPG